MVCPICVNSIYYKKCGLDTTQLVHIEQTEPIKEHYKGKKGAVAKINGDQSIDEVYADVKKALEE